MCFLSRSGRKRRHFRGTYPFYKYMGVPTPPGQYLILMLFASILFRLYHVILLKIIKICMFFYVHVYTILHVFMFHHVSTIRMMQCTSNYTFTKLHKYMSRAMRKCVMSYANHKGADQPAHPRSLISAFVVRCSDNIISLVSIAEISRL